MTHVLKQTMRRYHIVYGVLVIVYFIFDIFNFLVPDLRYYEQNVSDIDVSSHPIKSCPLHLLMYLFHFCDTTTRLPRLLRLTSNT